jgi:protein-S-isoprenylcysteine O-methyltransferase Ste14
MADFIENNKRGLLILACTCLGFFFIALVAAGSTAGLVVWKQHIAATDDEAAAWWVVVVVFVVLTLLFCVAALCCFSCIAWCCRDSEREQSPPDSPCQGLGDLLLCIFCLGLYTLICSD